MERLKALTFIIVCGLAACAPKGFEVPLASLETKPVTTLNPSRPVMTKFKTHTVLDGSTRVRDLRMVTEASTATALLTGILTLQPKDGSAAVEIPLELFGAVKVSPSTGLGSAEMSPRNAEALKNLKVEMSAKMMCLQQDCARYFANIYVRYNGDRSVYYRHQVHIAPQKPAVKMPTLEEREARGEQVKIAPPDFVSEANEDDTEYEEHDSGEQRDGGYYVGEPEEDLDNFETTSQPVDAAKVASASTAYTEAKNSSASGESAKPDGAKSGESTNTGGTAKPAQGARLEENSKPAVVTNSGDTTKSASTGSPFVTGKTSETATAAQIASAAGTSNASTEAKPSNTKKADAKSSQATQPVNPASSSVPPVAAKPPTAIWTRNPPPVSTNAPSTASSTTAPAAATKAPQQPSAPAQATAAPQPATAPVYGSGPMEPSNKDASDAKTSQAGNSALTNKSEPAKRPESSTSTATPPRSEAVKPMPKILEILAQAVDYVDAGSLQSPDSLMDFQKDPSAVGFKIMNPKKERYYATRDLRNMLMFMGSYSLKNVDNYVLSIGDVAREEGGKVGSHLSHQSGLDVDVSYYFNRESLQSGFVNVLDPKTKARSAWMIKEQWGLFKALVKTGYVNWIFVHPKLKDALCQQAIQNGELREGQTSGEALETLSFLGPDSYHANHFHLRLQCSSQQKLCYKAPLPPRVSGCRFPKKK